MKKLLSMVLVALLALSFAGCNKKEDSKPVQGKVLNIYAWNTEFQDRFNEYYEVPEGITVNWIINPSDDGVYQNKLDEALLAQEKAATDDKVDIFLIEADYALKYVNSDYTVDVMGNIGLTDDDVKDMYQYTKDICTDSDGKLKGVSWQACPAGLIYRRSIAKDVLGTDDPDAVQKALSTWEKYDAVAADAKAKGYYMTSSFVADYRVFSNNVSSPWVVDGKIVIDPAIEQWIEQAKNHIDNGYTLSHDIWDTASFAEAKKDGKAMCYFGPGWFFDFCLMPATLENADGDKAVGNGSYGDWGVVKGPQGYFWGGTWICAAAGTDNQDLIKDIMLKMTCDKDTLVDITEEMGDFTNNVAAMTEIANDSSYGHPFLGGQNHISQLLDSAQSISLKNISEYDQLLNEGMQDAMKDYMTGNVNKATALDNFYKAAIEAYPNLTK